MRRFNPPLALPLVFARDRKERDLSIGTGRFTQRAYRLSEISAEDLADFKSDAAHYAEGWVDQANPFVVASARATVAKLKDV